ncbi:MAG: hypothetical protein ACRERE_00210 [Candidatus Entotheonellia bacterium]
MASRYSAIVTSSLLIVVSTLSSSIPAVHAQELKPHPLMMVVDANGRRVGLLIGIDRATRDGVPSDVWVAFKVDEHVFALRLHKDRFLGTVNGFPEGEPGVGFESTDCSGTAFVATEASDESTLLPVTQVAGPGSTVYLQQSGAPSQLIAMQSLLNVDDVCRSGFLRNSRAYPALPLVDLAPLFTPPFHVR